MSLLATLCGAFAVVLSFASYLMRTHRGLTYVGAASVLCWALHFAFNEFWTPSVLSALMAMRIGASVKVVVLSRRVRWQLTMLVWAFAWLGAYLTWQGWVSVPSTVATTFLTYAGFHLGYWTLRRALLLGEVLWLVNAYMTGSTWGMGAAAGGFALNLALLWSERKNALLGACKLPPSMSCDSLLPPVKS